MYDSWTSIVTTSCYNIVMAFNDINIIIGNDKFLSDISQTLFTDDNGLKDKGWEYKI